jgi:hypothetical protein
MRLSFLVLLVGVISSVDAAEPKFLQQELLDAGWISLFDGETLYGWQPVGEAKWEVVDGEIRTSGESAGFLMTTTQWASFDLVVDFKAAEKTNSGVFLHTPLKPTDPARDCYELNIAPADNPYPTGSFVGRQKKNWKPDKFPTANEWHTLYAEVEPEANNWTLQVDHGGFYKHVGRDANRIGFIGLQSNSGPIAFRSIRLRPKGLKPLLNGRDLEGWNQERAGECTFDVTPGGELHLRNGPGQIETAGDFANFVLQLECKVNGDGLNSGIFFRTLREGRWAGYESQINNKFKDGDRTKPADFGTGGIYRRQPARRVVADDHKWFHKTIVADGPHVAVWVEGYQVSDWIDPRGERDNAREGKKLGPGAIAIQGHDPTTDFSFRNMSAAELPR